MIQEEDFMIGDWIKIVPFHDEKKSYFKRIENARDLDVIFDFQGFAEAIPITSEILKKNGFEPFSYTDQTCYHLKGKGYVVRAYQPKNSTHAYLNEIRNDNPWKASLNSARFKYVHELQHALKLCQIDKEIQL